MQLLIAHTHALICWDGASERGQWRRGSGCRKGKQIFKRGSRVVRLDRSRFVPNEVTALTAQELLTSVETVGAILPFRNEELPITCARAMR